MSEQKNFINWENCSRFIVLALAFLLPLWVLPLGIFNLAMSKSLLIFISVLAAAVFYLIHLLQEGTITYPKSIAVLSLFFILIMSLCSSFFSGIFSFSFFGSGAEVDTFAFLFASVILFLLAFLLFRSEKHILMFLFLLMASSVVLFFVQLVHSFLGFNFGGILANKMDTLIGSWNELAVFFSFMALMAIIFLEFFGSKLAELPSGRMWRIFLLSVIAMSLLVMAFINFAAAWIVFAIFLLVLFVYLFSSFGKNHNFARLPFFIILIAIFFILARPLMADLITSMGLNLIEVRPSWTATFEVVKSSLGDNFKDAILGTGPNTFLYDWFKFKPMSINETAFWSTRFQSGIGLLPTLVATMGLVSSLAWLFFLLVIVYYGIRTIGYGENDITKSLLFSTFLGSIYLWVFSIIYVPNHFLFILSFVMSGLFFAILAKSGKLKLGTFSFVNKGGAGFMASLLIVLLLISSVAAFYSIFQKYWAAYSYNKGLAVFNAEGKVDSAQKYFSRALRFDNQQDRYYRTLSELGLIQLSNFLSQPQQLSDEEVKLQFQNILAFVIQNAQQATVVNPKEPLNWLVLGQVYSNLVSLKIEGAESVALGAYKKALETSPADPTSLFSSAQVEIQVGNKEAARSYLNASLKLKSNYTSALFLLANLAAQEGDLDNAIRQTEMARLTAPNDVGVLFQLGLLYYQKKDYKNAQLTLERAVGVNSNYSNARYFLGLSYDKLGKKQEAIAQFEVIQTLNPDNKEVSAILSNLKAGRGALSEISPPQTAPEQREEPPIKDEGTAKSAE